MRPTPLLAMQALLYSPAFSDTIVFPIAKKSIGSRGTLRPIDTGRKGLVGISAPVGGHSCKQAGAKGICPTQIVPPALQGV